MTAFDFRNNNQGRNTMADAAEKIAFVTATGTGVAARRRWH
jgi:hypothetical protein